MLRLHQEETGFSLVELLVVIVILGVVGGITLTGLVQGMQTSARADERIEGFSELQRASERVSRDLRRGLWTETSVTPGTLPDGCVFLDLSPSAITLIVLDGTGRHRHAYQVADGRMTLTRETWISGAWQNPSTQFVIDGLTNGTTSDPIFSYLDAAGGDLVDPSGIEPEDRAKVRKFGLRLETELAGQGPIAVETIVGARNGGRSCTAAS